MLLDTDILIDLLRGKKEARDFLRSLPEDSVQCCSVITVAEIHSGMREGERQRTAELIDSLLVLPVTREIAETAGHFRRAYKGDTASPEGDRARGTRRTSKANELPKLPDLELDDCLIAATAAVEELELATRNRRHYPMPEVKVRSATY